MSDNFVSLTTRIDIVQTTKRLRNPIANLVRSRNSNKWAIKGDYHLPFGQSIPIPGNFRP